MAQLLLYSGLGFLQHVVIPSAYYTFMDRESDGFFIPLSSFDIVVKEVMQYSDSNDEAISQTNTLFNKLYQQLNIIQRGENSSKKDALQALTNVIDQHWRRQKKQKLSIKVFNKPSEIYDYLTSSTFTEFDEIREEMVGMSVPDFKIYCNQVYETPFINKSFIDRLNYQVPYLL